MDAWLTTHEAGDVLGADLTAGLEETPWEAAVAAAAEYVADHRPDLVALVDDVLTFVPTATVRFGTSLLALRWYSRRRATTDNGDEGGVADVIADDPDLSRMLGIGVRGAVVFGAPTLPAEVV